MYKNGIRRYLCFVVCAIAIAPIWTGFGASAQTTSNVLSFEVGSVKPVDPSYHFDGTHHWAHVYQKRASYWYMTLANLITYAYDVEPFQVIGPEWANADRFDIEATFPERANKKDDRMMLQALLKERFTLSLHIEKRELESYVLVVGKHGEKLRPSPPDPATPETDAPLKQGDGNVGEGSAKSKITTTQDGASEIDQGKKGTFSLKIDLEHWANHFVFSKMTMEQLAGRLNGCLGSGGHKVIDETGIKGNYQVAYDCPLRGPRPASAGGANGTLPSDTDDGDSLTRSLDALGLKLEKRKTLMDVYVIDHVERPFKN